MSSIETSVDDVARVEFNICESLNNPHQLSEAEQRDVTAQFHCLADNGVEFVGASPTGSIVVYFRCNTFQAVIFFKKSYDSGELKRVLESVFNCIAARSAIHLTVEVNLEETIYKQSISEARKASKSKEIFVYMLQIVEWNVKCCTINSVQFYNLFSSRRSEYLIVWLLQCTTTTSRKKQSIRISWCVQKSFQSSYCFRMMIIYEVDDDDG